MARPSSLPRHFACGTGPSSRLSPSSWRKNACCGPDDAPPASPTMTVARIWLTHVCVRNDAHQASDGAETEIPIVHLLPIRGSYMSGFAYACRRPKPFDTPERLLSRAGRTYADVRSYPSAPALGAGCRDGRVGHSGTGGFEDGKRDSRHSIGLAYASVTDLIFAVQDSTLEAQVQTVRSSAEVLRWWRSDPDAEAGHVEK